MTKTEAFRLLYGYRIPEGAMESYQALELDLAAANERLREVEKDARRYRWLRGNAEPGVFHIAFVANTLSSWKTSNEIDAAIDAALAGDK